MVPRGRGIVPLVEPTTGESEALVERRRLPRLKFSAPIQFRNILRPQESFIGSLSKDLSASGVRLTTFTFLPKDTRLVLLLSLPGFLKPTRIIARVVWMQRQRFTDAYDCGVQFLEIATEDRNRIADVVERGIVARPTSQDS